MDKKGQGTKPISGLRTDFLPRREETPLSGSLAEGSLPRLECLFSSHPMLEAGERAHRSRGRDEEKTEMFSRDWSLSLMRLDFFARLFARGKANMSKMYLNVTVILSTTGPFLFPGV